MEDMLAAWVLLWIMFMRAGCERQSSGYRWRADDSVRVGLSLWQSSTLLARETSRKHTYTLRSHYQEADTPSRAITPRARPAARAAAPPRRPRPPRDVGSLRVRKQVERATQTAARTVLAHGAGRHMDRHVLRAREPLVQRLLLELRELVLQLVLACAASAASASGSEQRGGGRRRAHLVEVDPRVRGVADRLADLVRDVPLLVDALHDRLHVLDVSARARVSARVWQSPRAPARMIRTCPCGSA
jgi:hypothetical protein